MVAKRAAFEPPSLATRFLGLRPGFSGRWAQSSAIWGVGAGIYVLYLLSVTPLVKREFLVKVPVIGSYYEDKRPPSDRTG